jgi:DNA-binding NarL/FixJ family response regulator
VSTRKTADERSKPDVAVEMAVDVAVDEPHLAARIRAVLRQIAGLRLAEADDDAAPAVRITDTAGSEGDVAVIVITDRDGAMEALKAGAAAVLSPHTDAQALASAIRAAAQGLTVLAAEFRDRIVEGSEATLALEAEPDAETASIDLTPRERQVLQLLAQGASNKAIARRLDITPHTAKFHVAAIIAKLGATGRTDAVARAMRLGLVMI